MSKNKHTSAACAIISIASVIVGILFAMGNKLGIASVHAQMPYEASLFSTDVVHKLDIAVNEQDWEKMIEGAQEEYISCNIVIDGVSVSNVGIRPKGNSSLSTIMRSTSDRYSFKIEFDHYEDGKSYLGLDKLALNNIAQDNTYMKDYVSYQMMNAFGADAPLSSFIYIAVNGEDWGLYLAVEGIEESFAQRVYGKDFGQIYKPDSMDMNDRGGDGENQLPGGQFGGQMRNWEYMAQRGGNAYGWLPGQGNITQGEGGQAPVQGGFPQGGEEAPSRETMPQGENSQFPDPANMQQWGGSAARGGMGGNNATALVYIDDEIESYASIFDNAVTDASEADEKRLIASLKALSEGVNIEQTVDVEEVMRYFVVHNFVLNFDSYTSNMTHNYYLREKDGRLSMIAWDYNLAFGGFGGMGMGGRGAESSTTSLVNYPIDSPLSGTAAESRPMIGWILSDENYLGEYNALFFEFISGYFDSGEFEKMYDNAIKLISPYVEIDPTSFCNYEDFVAGQEALREFCLLRAKSVKGQLEGTIEATVEGQEASENAGFVDASHIDSSSMGSNSNGFDRARGSRGFQRQDSWDIWNAPPLGDVAPEGSVSAGQRASAYDYTPSGDNYPINQNGLNQNGFNQNGFNQNEFNQNAANRFRSDYISESQANSNLGEVAVAVSLSLAVMIGGLIFAKKFKARTRQVI
ncbi:MAG: CotH kinase family protein [Clostridiales bacterium]|jgi:spore coat protein CotH|nr:CotH kinase family protein [Clostridiales bacterium]